MPPQHYLVLIISGRSSTRLCSFAEMLLLFDEVLVTDDHSLKSLYHAADMPEYVAVFFIFEAQVRGDSFS